jgi:uncharacterized membrane protein
MSFAQYLITYGLTLVAFLGIDAVWLGVIAKNLYKDNLGHLMAAKPSLLPAAIFYLLYVAGIMILAVHPALDKGSLTKAIVLGAIFGGIAYATYDLTNAATLKDWPLKITVLDILWGASLTAIVAGISYQIANWVS